MPATIAMDRRNSYNDDDYFFKPSSINHIIEFLQHRLILAEYSKHFLNNKNADKLIELIMELIN